MHFILSSEEKVYKSEALLKQIGLKTKEIEEICNKIHSSMLLEMEKMKREANLQISSYLTFREKYTEEKLKIFSYDKISSLKLKVINSAILVAEEYMKSNGTYDPLDSSKNLDTLLLKVISNKENEL